jgi:hypothetical protein
MTATFFIGVVFPVPRQLYEDNYELKMWGHVKRKGFVLRRCSNMRRKLAKSLIHDSWCTKPGPLVLKAEATSVTLCHSADTQAAGRDVTTYHDYTERGERFFCSPEMPRPALGPTSHLLNAYWGPFPWGAKWPGREADQSPPSTAQVKNDWSYNSMTSWGVQKLYPFFFEIKRQNHPSFLSFLQCLYYSYFCKLSVDIYRDVTIHGGGTQAIRYTCVCQPRRQLCVKNSSSDLAFRTTYTYHMQSERATSMASLV